MNILYFGTVCSDEEFETISEKSKIKPSAAPQTFETLLLKGFNKLEDVIIECNTFPPVPAIPNGYLFSWGRRKNKITDKITTKWIPSLNIQILKQIMFFLFSFLITIKWGIKNRSNKDKVILLYSIYTPIAYGTLLASKITGSKICVLVPDLPELMFSYSKEKGFKLTLTPLFIRLSRVIQSKFDGYILLTKFMKDVVNPKNKPYVVIEGISEDEELSTNKIENFKEKYLKKAIMYAGALNKNFGIDNLIKAFNLLEDSNVELWLFGSGDMEEKIVNYSVENPRIKFYGRKPKSEILQYEKKATLLVNIRNSTDEYTKYSFPSKTIEYMASGTPLLTTKLPGIPTEYYKYCYTLDNETVEGIGKTIINILKLPEKELNEKGFIAKKFIVENKNYTIQAEKIINFIGKI